MYVMRRNAISCDRQALQRVWACSDMTVSGIEDEIAMTLLEVRLDGMTVSVVADRADLSRQLSEMPHVDATDVTWEKLPLPLMNRAAFAPSLCVSPKLSIEHCLFSSTIQR